MIPVNINKKAAHSLLALKTEDKISSAFLAQVKFDGRNIHISKKRMEEIKQLANVFCELIINYNDQLIQHEP